MVKILYFDGQYEIVFFDREYSKPFTVASKGKIIFKHFDKFRKAKKYLKKVLNETIY